MLLNVDKIIKDKIAKVTPLHAGLFVAFITFAFPSIVINTQQPHGWIDWYRLATLGQEAQGRITRVQPEIHNTCYFDYSVNTIQYEGTDQGCNSQIGQLVTIKYLPTEPSFATTSSPIEELTFIVIGPLALSIFGGVGTAWSFSRRRRSPM
jgi:hypothetical protein